MNLYTLLTTTHTRGIAIVLTFYLKSLSESITQPDRYAPHSAKASFGGQQPPKNAALFAVV